MRSLCLYAPFAQPPATEPHRYVMCVQCYHNSPMPIFIAALMTIQYNSVFPLNRYMTTQLLSPIGRYVRAEHKDVEQLAFIPSVPIVAQNIYYYRRIRLHFCCSKAFVHTHRSFLASAGN